MRIRNAVSHHTITHLLNRPQMDLMDLRRRIDQFVASRGEVSAEDAHALWMDEVSRMLRHYVDQWLNTGIDKDGTEFPFQRNPFRAKNASHALLEYLRKYPPPVTLDPYDGLSIQIGFPPALSPNWNDFFVEANTEALSWFSGFIMSDGVELLGKCRYCDLYFLRKRKPRKQYPNGSFCSPAHARRPSAIRRTNERRMRVESQLIRRTAEHLWKSGIRNPQWQQDLKRKRQLADHVRGFLWDSKDAELKKYRESVGMKLGWVTRHQQEIEQVRLNL